MQLTSCSPRANLTEYPDIGTAAVRQAQEVAAIGKDFSKEFLPLMGSNAVPHGWKFKHVSRSNDFVVGAGILRLQKGAVIFGAEGL